MTGYHIARAYFRTKKAHSNRPDEIDILNVDIEKDKGDFTDNLVKIFLDKDYLAIIPSSKDNGIYKEDNGGYTIQFQIDVPKNLEFIPFRYDMKVYPMFGRHFTISNGNRSNEKYKG